MSIVIHCGGKSEVDQYASCKTIGSIMSTGSLLVSNAVLTYNLVKIGQEDYRFYHGMVSAVVIAMLLQVLSMAFSVAMFCMKWDPFSDTSDGQSKEPSCPKCLKVFNDAVTAINGVSFVVQSVIKVLEAVQAICV